MELLSGNEAIARGAWEAGARIATAYPGTPSTETLEAFAKMDGVYAEWCNNEKVALEVALGASIGGERVLCTMKHVGVNLAADPLYSGAYTGVNGGLVLLAADDPGMYSSQNEQDSHYHAKASHVMCIDPSDSQEALDFTKDAYELSEKFDTIVMIRSSVRISHTKTPVETSVRKAYERKPYSKNPSKWIMMPAFARPRRKDLLKRLEDMKTYANTSPLNKTIINNTDIGIICAGATYQHVKDALPEASILKLGITYPLADGLVKDFASKVKHLYVIEEGSEFLRESVAAAGVFVEDAPNGIPLDGELNPQIIAQGFGEDVKPFYDVPDNVPNRPPTLCTGCPHRVVFKELARLKAIVTGDIGCYSLGALAPLNAVDAVIDMGASVSMAHGIELALEGEEHQPIFGVIGDSTFAHSGVSSLLSTVYNAGKGNICVLDNRTTAMTGQQGNPFNGITLQNRPTREIDIEGVIRGLGIDDVEVVDPFDVKAVRAAVKSAAEAEDRLSVRIFKAPCQMLTRTVKPAYFVNVNCRACGTCATIGCPALSNDPTTKCAIIDPNVCIGCGQCSQYCAYKAIEQGN